MRMFIVMAADQYLSGVCAVIVEQGVGKGRTQILSKRLKEQGGRVLSSLEPGVVTHLLVGNRERRSRLPGLLGVKEVGSDVRVVRADWLTACLTARKYVSETPYDVPLEATPSTTPITKGEEVKKRKCPSPDSDSSYVDSGEEGEGEEGASGEVDTSTVYTSSGQEKGVVDV